MAKFACRWRETTPGAFCGVTGSSVGSGGNRPARSPGLGVRLFRLAVPLLAAITAVAAAGCASGNSDAAGGVGQAGPLREDRPPPAEVTQVVSPVAPAAVAETPEASLIRLSKMWDEAFAKRDETLLRRVFHPSFTGIDAEIANMNSPENKGTPTPVSEISVESEAPERVVLTAVFAYDEGPVRQRILLVGDARDRRIAGVQDVEE